MKINEISDESDDRMFCTYRDEKCGEQKFVTKDLLKKF